MDQITIDEHIFDWFDIQIDPDSLVKLKGALFNPTSEIPTAIPVVCRETIPTLTKHNFSLIIGLEGSRKTWFSLAVAASFFFDYLGFQSVSKGVLLWFDTEQSDEDLKAITDRFFRITELPKDTKQVKFFALREFRPNERRDIVEKAIEIYKPDMVILDGGADLLIKGANDEQDSTNAVNDLMRWTKIYNCHIVNVIHNSHGNEKARGHYGSMALRKCETAYLLTANGDVTTVKHTKTRKRRPNDFAFQINPLSVLPELAEIKKSNTNSFSRDLFTGILKPSDQVRYTDLCKKIAKAKDISEARAKVIIKEAATIGYIAKNTSGFYSLTDEDDEPLLG